MNTAQNDFIQKVIGEHVSNNAYGNGCISKFFLKDDGNYYVSVLFGSDNTEKTFLASTAFIKKILVMDNEELNKAVILMLERQVSKSKEDKQLSITKKSTEISSNDVINILIESVLENEQIAIELISFYDDESFEKELCTEAFGYLEKIMNGSKLSNAHKACVVCALSLIALKYYDGDLHYYIEKKYRESRPESEYKYSRVSIQNGIYKAIGDFREKTKYFDPRSYVAVPIVMSCVPHYRLKDLFKISYDIYKQKLLFDEDLSDEQIREKVAETFTTLKRKDLISDSETIKGTNYLMSKYTQSCIYSGYGIDSLSQIVSHCIRLIINHLTRPEDSFKVEPYYEEGYSAWMNAFESNDREKAGFESNRTISQPYLKYINNEVHLYTGEYSMDDSYNPNDVHICIYNGENLIQDNLITNPNTIEYVDESAMSGYVIKREEYVVPESPLGELSYKIVCSGQQLYDSKARLYRSSLFFDGKGNEIKPGSSYSGELFVITKKSNIDEYGERINELYKRDNYVISVVEVNDHEVFHFDGEPYIFYKISAAQLISYEIPWADFVSVEDKRFTIHNDITILFPSSCDKEDIYMEIDGKDYYYGDDADVRFSIRLFSKEYGETWAYTSKVLGLEAGYHTIRVFNSTTGKQIKGASFNIVYDPDLWKSYVSKDEKGILYELTGNFIDNQAILFEFGTEKKELHAFVKGLGHGSLVLYPSSISYSVDGQIWNETDKKLYLDEIPESLQSIMICGPKKMHAFYLDPFAAVKKQEISFESNQDNQTKYHLYIGFFRTLSEKKSVKISFEYGKRSKYLILGIVPSVSKEKSHFYFDAEKNTHYFDIRFKGSNKLKVVIKPLHFETVLVSKVIGSGELIEISDSDIDKSAGYLSVSLYSRKYGALFDPYHSEPFMTFPKYDLGRQSVKLKTFPPEFKLEKDVLSGKVDFDGADIIKADIVPSGFNHPLFSETLCDGERFTLDISNFPFNSYKLCLYNVTDDENSFTGIPFFTSKSIKAESPFLKKTLSVSNFIFSDGTKAKVSYSVRFYTIVEIKKKYYLVASFLDKSSGNIIKNLLISVKKASKFNYEVVVRRQVENEIYKLKFKNGKVLEGAIIEKFGGWL